MMLTPQPSKPSYGKFDRRGVKTITGEFLCRAKEGDAFLNLLNESSAHGQMVHLRQQLKFNLVHQLPVKSKNIERFRVIEVSCQIFQPVENLFGSMLKSPKVFD